MLFIPAPATFFRVRFVVTRRAKAYQITVYKRQVRPLVVVLNVMHRRRFDPAPVTLAALAHIPIAPQNVLALFQPAPAGVKIIHPIAPLFLP